MDQKTDTGAAGAQILKNEQGFILILALMMMLTLSLTGAAAMMMRNTEQFIVTNTEVSQNNFYTAEAITMEAVIALKKLSDDDDEKEVLLNPDEEHEEKYQWLARIDPKDEDWPPFDLSKNAIWYLGSPDIRPKETELNEPDNNIVPTGYDSDGTVDGDRIWYAVMRGTVNSDYNDRDNCGGTAVSDPTKVEKCFTVFGMYDVKPGEGKAYPGQRMLMVGYRHMVYY